MKNKKSKILLLVMIISLVLAGCGSSKTTSSEGYAPAIGGAPAAEGVGKSADAAKPEAAVTTAADQGGTGIKGSGTQSTAVSNIILSQRKMIRNANVSIQVDDYTKTYGKIQSLVEFSGIGYIQQSNVSKQGEYGRQGTIVIRVQADQFPTILNNIKGLGEVLDANESAEDVSEKFYDVDSELRLLKYEQERLEVYLKKISDPDAIFKTESRLTEIRHQIEGLTGTLNKLNDLVKLSTITINVTEKDPTALSKTEKGYWSKLGEGFIDNLKGVVNFFAYFLMFIIQGIPVLIPLIVIGWVVFMLFRKQQKKKNKAAEEEKNKQ